MNMMVIVYLSWFRVGIELIAITIFLRFKVIDAILHKVTLFLNYGNLLRELGDFLLVVIL